MDEMRPISDAPAGKQCLLFCPGYKPFPAIFWNDSVEDDDGSSTGAWHALEDGNHPPDWTDGICWEVNEDGLRSTQPTHFALLPEAFHD